MASGSNDKTVKIWDPDTGELRHSFEDQAEKVSCVTFSPNGRILAFAPRDGTIRLYEPIKGVHLHTLTGHSDSVNSIIFSPDSQLLASGSNDMTVRFWDPSKGTPHRPHGDHSSPVRSLTFSHDGKLVASESDDKTVKIWDSSTYEVRETFENQSCFLWSEENSRISIEDSQWLYYKGERRLWLPLEYRKTCLALKGNVLALGQASGKVSFISI